MPHVMTAARVLAAFTLAALLAACAEFIPVFEQLSYTSAKNKQRILVIWNHDSDGDGSLLDCATWRRPRWANAIDGETIAGMPVDVVFPCSATPADVDPAGRPCEREACKRARAIRDEVEHWFHQGYQRRHIFVAGFGEGAWAALLVKRAQAGAFNGVIATAPRFEGRREDWLCVGSNCAGEGDAARAERQAMRRLHEAYLLAPTVFGEVPLDAFVVGLACDVYGYPSDVAVTANSTVHMAVFPEHLRLPPPGDECDPDASLSESRWYGAEPRRLCREIGSPLRYERRDVARCGGARLAYCPPGDRAFCDRDLNADAIHIDEFTEWLLPEAGGGRLRQFIEERVSKAGDFIESPLPSYEPCAFVEYAETCPTLDDALKAD